MSSIDREFILGESALDETFLAGPQIEPALESLAKLYEVTGAKQIAIARRIREQKLTVEDVAEIRDALAAADMWLLAKEKQEGG